MSTHTEGDRFSLKTAADLSEKRFHIVKTDASGNLILATAATDDLLGVIDDGGRVSGDTADVVLINGSGTFKVKTGGNVSKGAYLTTNGSGQAIATTTAGNRVFGRALAAGTSGDIIEYVKYNEIHA